MKKSRILLAATASVLMLTGCAKSVNYEEAKTFVNETYSKKAAYDAIESCTLSRKSVVEKAEGVLEAAGPVGTTETKDEKVTIYEIVTENTLSENEKFKYKIDGKKFEIHYTLKDQEIMAESSFENVTCKGTSTLHIYYNEYGAMTKYVSKVDYSISYSLGGLLVSGALKSTETKNYTYVFKK